MDSQQARSWFVLAMFFVFMGLLIAIIPLNAQAASLFCSWHLTPGMTEEKASLDHHFDVELKEFPDMTALVEYGLARIYYRGQRQFLHPWAINKWGVPTKWVSTHWEGFLKSSNWIIIWRNGFDGIYCHYA